MICERCKANIADTAKFCPKCGSKVELIKSHESQTKKCPSCGAENPISAKICRIDGYKFQMVQENESQKHAGAEKSRNEIICPKCGVSYPVSTKFCKIDGTPLHKFSPSPDVTMPPKVQEKEIKTELISEPDVKVAPTKVEEPKLEVKESIQREVKPDVVSEEVNTTTVEEKKLSEKTYEDEIQSNIIICPRCGTPNHSTAKFCKKDGTSLREVIKSTVEQEAITKVTVISEHKEGVSPKYVAGKEGFKKTSKKKVLVAFFGLVFLIASVGGFLYFSGLTVKKPSEVATTTEINKPSEPPKQLPEETEINKSTESPNQLLKETENKLSEPPKQLPERVAKSSEVTPSRETPKVEKPLIPKEPRKENILPPKPAKPDVDIIGLEREINRSLRNRGLISIYAEVNPQLVATLKGTAESQEEIDRAVSIVRSHKDITGINNNIQIARIIKPHPPQQPPPNLPELEAKQPLPNPSELEGRINRALRNSGLRTVTAQVSDDLQVTLKGSVSTLAEKNRAFEIANSFKEAKKIKDVIFVVEQ